MLIQGGNGIPGVANLVLQVNGATDQASRQSDNFLVTKGFRQITDMFSGEPLNVVLGGATLVIGLEQAPEECPEIGPFFL
ncbi:hypothetical protein AN478_07045 [Thiohalorhabdus denitrificans]|nr:hypothetical protein AN478_07045 [Thiohalorhabdus denitrificans]